MDLSDATRMAAQILDEERRRATIGYEPIIPESPFASVGGVLGTILTLGEGAAQKQLAFERKQRPRPVHSAPA